MLSPPQKLDLYVEVVRGFNRFYAQRMGIFMQNAGYGGMPISLTEMRIVYEIFVNKTTTAKELCRDLSMDAGYLSRILQRLEQQDLIIKRMSKSDGRQRRIALTVKGRKVYNAASEYMNGRIQDILQTLNVSEKDRLVEAMQEIEMILQKHIDTGKKFVLRPHKEGDMQMISNRHVMLFAKEYGWNEEFEALVNEMTNDFIRNYDPSMERCWVADMEGDIVGSVFVVRKGDDVCELRLLFVDPNVRSLGIGTRMLREAVRFSRYTGYKKMVMWTESVRDPAAKMFEEAGFHLVEETPHHRFGCDMIGQYWELDL